MKLTPRALTALLSLCVLITSARAADVTVNVTDASTHKPLSGAKVTVGGGRSKQDFYTGDDGSTKVPVTNAKNLYLQVSSDGFAPLYQYYNQRGPSDTMPDHFDFSLEHAITISGTVVDQDNNPLPGAKVFMNVQKRYSTPNVYLGNSWTTATTDAMGNWTFDGIPETFDSINMGASHRDCIGDDTYVPLNPFKDIAALKNGTASFKLTRGVPVTITVTDENGSPIRNATITYGDNRSSNSIPTEKTNSKGVCTLGIKAGVSAPLTIVAKNYSPEFQRVVIGKDPQAINIKLEPGHLLEGTVLEANGDPAAKASVYIESWRGVSTINKRLTTDVDGHFSWTEAPADEVKVQVSTPHGEKSGITVKAGDENKITITPFSTFKGTVVDAATNQPIDKYTVVLGIAWQNDQGIQNWDYSDMNREVQQTGSTFDVNFRTNYPFRAVRVSADGYLPTDGPIFPMDGKAVEFTFKMEKGEPVTGKILNADGSPLANTQVALVTSGGNFQLQNGEIPDYSLRNSISSKTTADGSFSLPCQRDDFLVVAATPAGFVEADRAALNKNHTLTIQPWGRIQGVAMHGTKPAPGVTIDGYTIQRFTGRTQAEVQAEQRKPRVNSSISTTTDDQGKFTIEHVFPGDINVGIRVPMGNNSWTTTNAESVTVEAGKTASVQVGGKGRTITGRIVLPADIEAQPHNFQYAYIQDDRAFSGRLGALPKEFYLLPRDQRSDWRKKYEESDAGKKALEEQKKAANRRNYNIPIKADGTFSADGIPEGSYRLNGAIFNRDANGNSTKQLAFINATFTVPPIPGGVSDEPLDIGTLPATAATARGSVSVPGQPQITTLDGKPVEIETFQKKNVLVYVFSANNPASDGLNEKIKPVYDAFGKNEDFTILGLIFNTDNAAAKAYVADHHIPWTVATIDEKNSEMFLAELAGQDFPSASFIKPRQGPNLNIAPDKLLATVQSAMASQPAPAPAAASAAATTAPAKTKRTSKPAPTVDPNLP